MKINKFNLGLGITLLVLAIANFSYHTIFNLIIGSLNLFLGVKNILDSIEQ